MVSVSDSFNRPNGVFGSDWEQYGSELDRDEGWEIVSNEIGPNGDPNDLHRYSYHLTPLGSADHEAEMEIGVTQGSPASNSQIGVCVRMSNSAISADGYMAMWDYDGNIYIRKTTGGSSPSRANLVSGYSYAPSSGDKIKLRVSGTANVILTVYLDTGSGHQKILETIDSSSPHDTGNHIGVYCYNGGSDYHPFAITEIAAADFGTEAAVEAMRIYNGSTFVSAQAAVLSDSAVWFSTINFYKRIGEIWEPISSTSNITSSTQTFSIVPDLSLSVPAPTLVIDGGTIVSQEATISLNMISSPIADPGIGSSPIWAQGGFFDQVGLSDAGALSAPETGVTFSSVVNQTDRDYTSQVTFDSGAAGSTFTNCRFMGGSIYTIINNINSDDSVTFTNCYFENTFSPPSGTGGKVIWGGGTFHWCHIVGGGDGVHMSTGRAGMFKFYKGVIEEQDYYADDHVDCVQFSSEANVEIFKFIIEDSVLQNQWDQQNGCIQIYTDNLAADCFSTRNWYHGGVYAFQGTSLPSDYTIYSEGDYFAWQSQQGGLSSTASLSNAMWWNRQLRPRQSGAGSNYTPAGNGTDFPGDGELVSEYPF
jgi:hypothetical protein